MSLPGGGELNKGTQDKDKGRTKHAPPLHELNRQRSPFAARSAAHNVSRSGQGRLRSTDQKRGCHQYPTG